MRYFVEVGGRKREVVLTPRPDGEIAVTVGGRSVDASVVWFGPRAMMARVEGRVLDMTLEGSAPQLGVVASGRRTYVKVESERMRAASRAVQDGGGARERDVRSPMPGRVVKVLVNVGDTVAPGTAVVIVEAMKMENEVRARKGGVVTQVRAVAGATVEANAVLVSFG